jgi:hypothetical protein
MRPSYILLTTYVEQNFGGKIPEKFLLTSPQCAAQSLFVAAMCTVTQHRCFSIDYEVRQVGGPKAQLRIGPS